jgi:hypothetical protein
MVTEKQFPPHPPTPLPQHKNTNTRTHTHQTLKPTKLKNPTKHKTPNKQTKKLTQQHFTNKTPNKTKKSSHKQTHQAHKQPTNQPTQQIPNPQTPNCNSKNKPQIITTTITTQQKYIIAHKTCHHLFLLPLVHFDAPLKNPFW